MTEKLWLEIVATIRKWESDYDNCDGPEETGGPMRPCLLHTIPYDESRGMQRTVVDLLVSRLSHVKERS